MRGAGTRFLLIHFNTFSRRTSANPIIQDELTSEVSKQKIKVGPFLYAQLTRYGAMTFPQMEWALAGRTARSNLYARVYGAVFMGPVSSAFGGTGPGV